MADGVPGVGDGDSMSDPRTVQIGACTVELWSDFLRTVLRFEVPAAGNDDADSIRRAWELGYGGNTWHMSRDHELLHSLIAEQRGEPYSRVLLGVGVRAAGGCKEDIISQVESDDEEALVLDVQRWILTGVSSPRLVWSRLDLERLKQRLGEITGE